MKFKFSLEKVLKQRQIQLDLVRKEYLEAVDFYNQEKQILNEMIETKEQALSNRSMQIQKDLNWQASVLQINDFVQGQIIKIQRQNERLDKISKIVEMRQENLRIALSEVKMMEKLKEKKKEEFIKEYLQKESKELDEIATMRHVRLQNNKEENKI